MLGRWQRALQDIQMPDAGPHAQLAWSMRLRRCESWLDLGQFARAGGELAEIGSNPAAHFKFAVTALCETARMRRWTGQPLGDGLARARALLPPGAQADLRLRVEWEALHASPAGQVMAQSEPILGEARALGLDGIVIAVWWVRAARLRDGAPAMAAAAAEQALALAPDIDAYGLYKPELWWHAALALQAAGHAERAAACVRHAAAWVHERVRQGDVPPEFVDSFLHRNPVNRELLAWAGRLGVSPSAVDA